MTSRQVYEAVLIELNKVQAPSLLLEDFNYLFNKAIYQYINKRYNIYDINQQTTDDIRVLKATAIIPMEKTSKYGTSPESVIAKNSLYGATYEGVLPMDYLHLLNCVCEYNVKKQFKCYDKGTYVQFNAVRLTSDIWGQVINNFYMRPMYKRPYYYIHNVNQLSGDVTKAKTPTNPYDANSPGTTDHADGASNVINFSESKDVLTLPRTLDDYDAVERDAELRFGNVSQPRIEIRYGKDDSLFELERIYVDYIKSPQNIRLTQEQLDLTEDTSQIMEFPDYICQEIINELVHIVMENSSDPRLQTHIPVSQSIANPAQAQEPAQQQRA